MKIRARIIGPINSPLELGKTLDNVGVEEEIRVEDVGPEDSVVEGTTEEIVVSSSMVLDAGG